jgi:phospholipid-binding lipoprotein MlaA
MQVDLITNTTKKRASFVLLTLTLLVFSVISGCASTSEAVGTRPAATGSAAAASDEPVVTGRLAKDPFERYNRAIFSLNDSIDNAVLKPVANAYRQTVPSPVRGGVANFFNNIEDAWSFVNSTLQLRPRNAIDNGMRVMVNTFFGLGGILDVAGEMGIERHSEDLGKTLGRWGVPAGPYVVFPLYGPTTLRDSFAISFETSNDLLKSITPISARNAAYGLRLVDTRAELLRVTGFLDDAALDRYSFARDAFLQKRRADILEGKNMPDDKFIDAPEDKEPAAPAK